MLTTSGHGGVMLKTSGYVTLTTSCCIKLTTSRCVILTLGCHDDVRLCHGDVRLCHADNVKLCQVVSFWHQVASC